MDSKFVAACVAAFSVTALSSAWAQDAPKARADVKAEARAATKAGEIPRGEAQPKQPASASTKTRAQRKAETRAARKAGQLAPAGSLGPEREPKEPKSTTARAPIKAETKAAVKAGTIPRGEASTGLK